MGSLLDTYDRKLVTNSLGFDKFFHALESTQGLLESASNFPHVNIIKNGEHYRLEMAVAGYSEDDIDISYEKNRLIVSGKVSEQEKDKAGDEYIIRGITGRAFKRSFLLIDTVVVRNASMKNGILTINLENIIPEEQKPRQIPISKVK